MKKSKAAPITISRAGVSTVGPAQFERVVLLSPAQQKEQQRVNAALLQSKRFKAWSFSRWYDYEGCPRFAAWKHLLKQGDKKSAAMDRGSDVHAKAEGFVKGTEKKVAPELAVVGPLLTQLRKLKRVVSVEASWGFTRTWQPCAWDDWANCWLRVKMDAHYLSPKEPELLEMIDWKTGKPKPEEHSIQLKLYGVAGLKRFLNVERAHGVLHYTDHGTKSELTVMRKEEKTLVKYWEAAVKPMFNDERYAPKPGPKCKWCPFSKEKGGACQF